MLSNDGAPYLTQPRLAAIAGLVHGFGTAAWTLKDAVSWAGRRGFRAIVLKQIHSDIVRVIEGGNVERAAATRLPGDALVTDLPGVLLVVKTADCLPGFLVDEARRVVAAVHCGWRGTRSRIVEKTIEVLSERYGAPPDGLLAALGPCIGRDCYEVGDDVRSAFAREGFPGPLFRERTADGPGYLFDLRAANVASLRAAGVREANIVSDASCTHCEPHLLSFRRDQNKDARMASFIGLAG